MIGLPYSQAHQGERGGDEPLGLAQRQVIQHPQGQRRVDGYFRKGILPPVGAA